MPILVSEHGQTCLGARYVLSRNTLQACPRTRFTLVSEHGSLSRDTVPDFTERFCALVSENTVPTAAFHSVFENTVALFQNTAGIRACFTSSPLKFHRSIRTQEARENFFTRSGVILAQAPAAMRTVKTIRFRHEHRTKRRIRRPKPTFRRRHKTPQARLQSPSLPWP